LSQDVRNLLGFFVRGNSFEELERRCSAVGIGVSQAEGTLTFLRGTDEDEDEESKDRDEEDDDEDEGDVPGAGFKRSRDGDDEPRLGMRRRMDPDQ
jgi:hypothetical protein